MRQKCKHFYDTHVGTSANLLRGLRAFLGRRFSYFSDMRRIYRVLPRQLRIRFWIFLVLQILRSIVEMSTIFVIALLTQSVSSPAFLRRRSVYRLIVPLLPWDWPARLEDNSTLIIAICFLVVAFIVVKNIVVCATLSYSIHYSEHVGLFVSQKAFGRYFSQDYLWHISPQGKALIPKIEQRGQLTSLITSIMQIFGNGLCAFMMFSMLFIIHAKITAVVVTVFSAVCIVSYTVLRKRIDRSGGEIGVINAQQNWAIRMAQRGIREILIYRKQDVFLESIIKNTRDAIPLRTFVGFSGNIPGWLLEVTGFFIIFAVMVYLVERGTPTPIIVSSMSILLLTAWRVLPMVSRSMGQAVRILAIRQRALQCLELVEELNGLEERQRPAPRPGFHMKHALTLKDAGFVYPGAKRPSLDNITLEIKQGESVALIGPSGAGKSTLGMLLAGLLPLASGTFHVDGEAIVEDNLDSYRQLVGYVPQAPLLLPGSIADNVALAHWGEQQDREKILRVCRLAAMDYIETKPGGIDFRIGDMGEGLSGGETQRLSIARALYTDPELIIFDEATSSLDRASELVIENTLKEMRGKATCVVIAHRLQTVEHCDKIVWLEKGRIREIGPPAEILEKYTANTKALALKKSMALQNP